MKQDYLSQVLPAGKPALTAADLPPGAQIRQAEHQASAIHGSLDMIRFTEAEREQVGPASTPEELELSSRYAELTDAFPSLLTRIGRQPGAMRHGQALETSLHVYQQANHQTLRAARGALVLAGAALTEANDRVEAAAHALATDPAVAAARRAIIGSAVSCIDELRETGQRAQKSKRSRKERKSAWHEAELELSRRRVEQLAKLAELGRAPLPAPRP